MTKLLETEKFIMMLQISHLVLIVLITKVSSFVTSIANAFRAAQTIIPDIRAELPDTLGGTRREYLEVKTVSGLRVCQ